MNRGIITWGIGSFFAHTPTWAKKIIIATVSIIVAIYMVVLTDPNIFGVAFYSFWTEYSLKIGFFISIVCQAIGVKCPLDKSGKPVTQPADRPAIADTTCTVDNNKVIEPVNGPAN